MRLNKPLLKLGLTGNIGTGKSTVARLMEKYGAKVLDADKVVHRLLEREDIKQKIVKRFGKEVLTEDGKIDRKKLAQKVFKNEEELKWLEKLLHPEVYKEYENFCRKYSGICVLEAALIFENKNADKFHYTVAVYAPKEIAKERAIKRGLTEEDFEKRWSRQMDIEKKIQLADFVIDNSKSLEETEKQVRELMFRLQSELGRFC
jgi:dephospho-CoA kinase